MTARLLRSARHNRPTLLALLLAGFSLAGCQSATPQLSEAYPPEYAAGFGDGCASGRQAGGALVRFRKDVPRYLGQPLYAEGWNDAIASARHCCRRAAGSPSGAAMRWSASATVSGATMSIRPRRRPCIADQAA